MRSIATPGLDAFFGLISRVGYQYGVIPIDIAIVLVLLALRRWRESTFAALGFGGSALLNMGAKQFFQRNRPSLWESIAPESTFSFPSGHAMGLMTLAAVVVALAWKHALALAGDHCRQSVRSAGGRVADLPGRALPLRHPGRLVGRTGVGGRAVSGDVSGARRPHWRRHRIST